MGNSLKRYYVGWDVSGWHTDRDALCVLTDNGPCPQLEGEPWCHNLRDLIVRETGWQLLASVLRNCCVEIDNGLELIFAIDAPLGWPISVTDLLTGYKTEPVGSTGKHNPYLFRATELFLKERGFQPKSVVSDRIGSPSTKAIHFLSVVELQPPEKVGVWEDQRDQKKVTVIETYPAVCKRSMTLNKHFCTLSINGAFQNSLTGYDRYDEDLKDALYCALVAWMFAANRRNELQAPDENVPAEEGWIWVPQDALKSTSDQIECGTIENG